MADPVSEPRAGVPVPLPPPDDWRTTDQDEINRRRLRAREEAPQVTNRDPAHPVFSNFDVHSPSGVTYSVELRDLTRRLHHCECVDFRVNGLGTCKHVEAVLETLERQRPMDFALARQHGSTRIDLVRDHDLETLRVERGMECLPRPLRRIFDTNGLLAPGYLPEMALEIWRGVAGSELRISQEVEPWLECRRRMTEGVALRRSYEHNVQAGTWPAQETLLPLFPYQREGMLHLACAERALLADEMGLGKTVQAVAASAMLRRLGRVERVLVVTPSSLQGEWEEQIRRFTRLPHRILGGTRLERSAAYDREKASFFTVVTYEAMLTDALEINERLRPEVVILDEAQRIKNWNTKTALAVKRLRSRYAWVLTGTPLENRIDELYSLVSFLDPTVFGPLFRFNREFYEFDERGRPRGHRNLDRLRARIKPLLLRRRKVDVATELPNLVERTFLVPMSDGQRTAYQTHEAVVSRLLASNRRKPLAEPQRERLLREMNMLRMICDSVYILDQDQRACPKLDELSRILSECMGNPEVKVLIFSEWERMLELVGDLCRRLRIDFAAHTGSISTTQRRQEVQRFREDPACRVLLSTDTGGTGLNLQNASVVINCDQPWNPARLEQRVARAWRQDQTRAVTVLNLVSERTIEQKMLGTLAIKQALSSGVIDGGEGGVGGAKAAAGKENFLHRLEQLMPLASGTPVHEEPAREGRRGTRSATPALVDKAAVSVRAPADAPLTFCRRAVEVLNGALLSCEERFPTQGDGSVLLLVVDHDAAKWQKALSGLAAQYLAQGVDGERAPDVRLEVIDRAAADLLRRLAEDGLIHSSTRATRVLYPPPETSATAPLSALEQNRVCQARETHARKLKMARVLVGEEMIEEARAAMLSAIYELGRALAIEHRQAEPANALGALAPPLDAYWQGGDDALGILRAFLTNEHAPVQPVLALLGQPVETGAKVAKDFFAGIKAKLATINS